MTAEKLKSRINSICTHVLFDYHGNPCGVDPISSGHFDMWCGNDYTEAHSIDEVMQMPFFDGKALQDIVNEIENIEM